jgi:lipopolysaccharide transport system ATP-binding protein
MEAIRIEDVWKTYRRGKSKRGDLRQNFSYWWDSLWNSTEEFNALESINLQIEQGEVVGLLGPNGAGKSTLLKLLSRITYPTKGRLTVNGTLSSLLEVGIGFHPELTGRDNIYLNGVIHGMTRKEIDRKFDSIVDFSGLEQYLDTPIKRYSSGMYVRLAFSVAAHLDSDILLLDEVLGVGDLEFKRKSLAKLKETVVDGRTIIIVSHQLDVLRELCTQGVYLDQGKIKQTGKIEEVIDFYLSDHEVKTNTDLSSRKDRQGNGKVMIAAIRFTDQAGQYIPEVHSGQYVKIQIQLSSAEPILHNLEIRLDVLDKMGQQWLVFSNNVSDGMIESANGHAVPECTIPKFPLAAGHYVLNVSLNENRQRSDLIQDAFRFTVLPGNFYKTGRTPDFSKGVLVEYHWGVKE